MANVLSVCAQEAPRIDIQFRALQLGDGNYSDLHFQNTDGEVVQLELSRIRRTPNHRYQGVNPIIFFDEAINPEDQTILRVPVASIEIPKGMRSPLLFFEKKQNVDEDALPYKVHMMDESLSAFPNETFIAFNLTGAKLFGKMNDEDITFKSGPSDPIEFGELKSPRIALAISTNDGPKMVFTNKLRLRPQERTILMLAPPRRRGSIQILAYTITESAR